MNNVDKRDHMDLTNVQTPSDLVNLNKGPDIETLVEQLLELNPTQNFLLMKRLCEVHLNYHNTMCEKLHGDGEYEQATIWERDAALMEVAYNVLKQVTV